MGLRTAGGPITCAQATCCTSTRLGSTPYTIADDHLALAAAGGYWPLRGESGLILSESGRALLPIAGPRSPLRGRLRRLEPMSDQSVASADGITLEFGCGVG